MRMQPCRAQRRRGTSIVGANRKSVSSWSSVFHDAKVGDPVHLAENRNFQNIKIVVKPSFESEHVVMPPGQASGTHSCAVSRTRRCNKPESSCRSLDNLNHPRDLSVAPHSRNARLSNTKITGAPGLTHDVHELR